MRGTSLVTKGMICPLIPVDGTSVSLSGTIEIEPNRWQLIAIPIETGYWDTTSSSIVDDQVTTARVNNYIIAQIQDKYVGGGETIGDYVEIVNTFFGDINAFYTWNSASPPPDSSPNNFPLTYIDGTRKEYAGMWVKSVTANPLIIEWGVP